MSATCVMPANGADAAAALRREICLAMRAIFSASSPMRSRSVTVLLIAMISRRSPAAGWRLAMMWLQSLSMLDLAAR